MGTVSLSINRCLNLCAGYGSTRAFDVTRHMKRTHGKPATSMDVARTADAVLSPSDTALLPPVPLWPPSSAGIDDSQVIQPTCEKK